MRTRRRGRLAQRPRVLLLAHAGEDLPAGRVEAQRQAGLGHAPGIGTARPELGKGIRLLPHGRYFIFYREAHGGLRIERIMHSARDAGDDDFEQQADESGN